MGTYLETALLSFPSYLPLLDRTYCLLFVSVTGMKAPSEQGSRYRSHSLVNTQHLKKCLAHRHAINFS